MHSSGMKQRTVRDRSSSVVAEAPAGLDQRQRPAVHDAAEKPGHGGHDVTLRVYLHGLVVEEEADD